MQRTRSRSPYWRLIPLWPAGDSGCFLFVLIGRPIETPSLMGQIASVALPLVPPMLPASRSLIQHHREVAAVLATYGLFTLGVLLLAWVTA